MSSKHKLQTSETNLLKQNIEEQLHRLLRQLNDLREEKDNLDADEYEDMEKDTLDQLKEFQESLKKMVAGNLTLEDELSSVKMALQAAISKAFSTPEVIKLFARKEPKQLRERLEELKTSVKTGKLTVAEATGQSVEILIALKKLGEDLTERERLFLADNMTQSMAEFEATENDMNESTKEHLINLAKSNIQSAKQ